MCVLLINARWQRKRTWPMAHGRWLSQLSNNTKECAALLHRLHFSIRGLYPSGPKDVTVFLGAWILPGSVKCKHSGQFGMPAFYSPRSPETSLALASAGPERREGLSRRVLQPEDCFVVVPSQPCLRMSKKEQGYSGELATHNISPGRTARSKTSILAG